MDERALREEELNGVSGGTGQGSANRLRPVGRSRFANESYFLMLKNALTPRYLA